MTPFVSPGCARRDSLRTKIAEYVLRASEHVYSLAHNLANYYNDIAQHQIHDSSHGRCAIPHPGVRQLACEVFRYSANVLIGRHKNLSGFDKRINCLLTFSSCRKFVDNPAVESVRRATSLLFCPVRGARPGLLPAKQDLNFPVVAPPSTGQTRLSASDWQPWGRQLPVRFSIRFAVSRHRIVPVGTFTTARTDVGHVGQKYSPSAAGDHARCRSDVALLPATAISRIPSVRPAQHDRSVSEDVVSR